MSAPDLLYANGIEAHSGEYWLPPLSPAHFSRALGQFPAADEQRSEIQLWRNYSSQGMWGVPEGVDEADLAQTGWGVLFAPGLDEAVYPALSELLAWRKEQAGELYREYRGQAAPHLGETKMHFLSRYDVGPGTVDPRKMPYYLLIVGDPQRISYRFQYQLDFQYAVGRVHFDTAEDYANYAHSVVRAEKESPVPQRRAIFFAPRNEDDPATALSASKLVSPLGESTRAALPGWRVECHVGDQATKSQLTDVLCAKEVPAFLFAAAHGLAFLNGDPRQISQQGALICQDWPGRTAWRGALPQEFYFAGDDLSGDARVAGMIAMFFACYGAGTPQFDDFGHTYGDQRGEVAPRAFLACLPQRLLTHPKGGALAVIGHVDRAWGWSFYGEGGPQLTVFESTLRRLLKGQRVGHALDEFNLRYGELAIELSSLQEEQSFGLKVAPDELVRFWTMANDARNYVLLGDPAVRLMTA